MNSDELFFDEISTSFYSESDKLKKLIADLLKNQDPLPIDKIIPVYYQIINVSSISTVLKQQLDTHKHKALLSKILETDEMISEEFNSSIHPQIMEKLTNSIQATTETLQSNSSAQKSQEDIENEAKLYEELRKKMSTKEFVEQYDKGLSND
jgi:hypothetical protein